MKTFFFLFLIFKLSLAGDIILEALNKYVDYSVSPCENFYRHACPIGSGLNYDTHFRNVPKEMMRKFSDDEAFKLTILKDLSDLISTNGRVIQSQWHDLTIQEFEKMCNLEEDTLPLLEVVENLLSEGEDCVRSQCVTVLKNDRNCSRAAATLRDVIHRFKELPLNLMIGIVELHKFQLFVEFLYTEDFAKYGIDVIKAYLSDMQAIVTEWADKTPWLINSKALEAFQKIQQKVHVISGNSEQLLKSITTVFSIETKYLKCLSKISFESNIDVVLCSQVALRGVEIINPDHMTHATGSNAFNLNPYLAYGFAYIYEASNLLDEASKLGSIGGTVGHEFGHTLFEDYRQPDNLIPYFSKEVQECIFNQYNNTCDVFGEECVMTPRQLEESGADVIGNQLAYKMLTEYYKDTLTNKHPLVDVTYQQLFFYAYAISFCHPEEEHTQGFGYHPPTILRVNSLSNMPEFLEAFNCPAESAMARSSQKQCFMLGENAPISKVR